MGGKAMTGISSSSHVPILYEDNHLMVVEKPVNIPSQGDASGDMDLLTLLKEDLRLRYRKKGNVYLGLVHRLDRPVGGLMVFAKTSKGASRLSEQVRNRTFQKTYLAVVHGQPAPSAGRLEHYLLKDRRRNMVRVVPHSHPKGKKAILDYSSLESRNGFTLVRIGLQTGRSHQIRVQFATIGHPLYGDQKYGAHVNQPGQQIALWSSELRLIHPTRKEGMHFTSIPSSQAPWNLFSYQGAFSFPEGTD
jgi:23S rRNA pseudouridine1911/1915/1917 synthase